MAKTKLLDKIGHIFSICLVSIFISVPSKAKVETDGCVNNTFCTLQELFNGGSMIVDDKKFSNWTPVQNPPPTNSIDLTMIQVSGLDDQPANPGLNFMTNNQLKATGILGQPEILQLGFNFRVEVINGKPIIKDNSLTSKHNYSNNADGLIELFEQLRDADGNPVKPINSKSNPSSKNFNEDPVIRNSDFVEFDEPLSILNIRKLIKVEANLGMVSLDEFEQRFSQVTPEPSTILSLLTIGGIVLGASKKKQS